MTLVLKDEVYAVVGAAMEVYNILGNGYLEAVYQEALEYELAVRGLPFVSQPELMIKYKSRVLKQRYRPDLVGWNKVIVELKAIERLGRNEEAQLLHYLKATEMAVGMLINFGSKEALEWKRMVYTPDQKTPVFRQSESMRA